MGGVSELGKQVVEELGGRFHAGDQEMAAGAGARDVEQVALGGVDLVELGLIAYSLDPFLRRQYLVVACGDYHGAKLQALGKVHQADRAGRATRTACGRIVRRSGGVLNSTRTPEPRNYLAGER